MNLLHMTVFTNINSYGSNTNVKCKTMNLEVSTGENLGGLGFGDDFLNIATKA